LTSENSESIFGYLVGLLGRGSARRKATLPTKDSTTQNNAGPHPCLERDLNIGYQCSSGRRPCLRPRGRWDRL